jgi:DNA-binding XRE family transcriptional regulator
MDKSEFTGIRRDLKRTQQEMAEMLGTSAKAVQSFEQGWRNIPPHVERQMLLFLAIRRLENDSPGAPCWEIRNCSEAMKARCPAWEFRYGRLCWFINGKICSGKAKGSWKEKIEECRACEVFVALMAPRHP